jgi:hypothetical protein
MIFALFLCPVIYMETKHVYFFSASFTWKQNIVVFSPRHLHGDKIYLFLYLVIYMEIKHICFFSASFTCKQNMFVFSPRHLHGNKT